ncbi:diphosphomevalonate decarboxylase [Candidatus Gottesmanbacteria bacterium CG11_big_fil_rev_8_21_14_0_20_37_11]|uniref:diphosphomevalonate decarboxylase n=3 Tax=Candidatus Gottesmaniibacteriota TaxID=1752720 RepID=A0A2M7RS03_9BACT|nr:MAG: diphosphomevalonate decarboxylase [Candidatus Gottesmanbacteria bacterium CG1_02_37_22]PIP32367.1 MAG: diphosphomevalonate decarboxylase [Candidatus Gottesmanbacteria bacterium CG23_combo_of_CG06-09_8_20_14_all_37_19]PIR07811.1 MAG: diphosphomevalonate decarboxylase [Candidatus Gottesmanbacteria bacterium CG11_big_fil_rev_8_21_14_0_20_37_11]PIZ02829.1 MAG: diphosphomevalonate decarboxylase [Candidatus Gottesmanbacteria bacterium CG_4_10_14_0_8_um_filter_37_24]
MIKSTSIAPSNIAFIKYWGKKDSSLKLPLNGSVSMNLSGMTTTTTVEFKKDFTEDEILIENDDRKKTKDRVSGHLDKIRQITEVDMKAKVVSRNNFPSSTGLSSSSSAFAALTLAAVNALNLHLSEKDLSILARQGSGSACRSIPDGFVEWLEGEDSNSSYSYSLHPPEYFDIADVVIVVSDKKKDISSTEGQILADTSPFMATRLANIKDKIIKIKQIINKKDFSSFGQLIESEALEMHAIMLTSNPPLIYWQPGTINIIKLVKKMRTEGLEVYFSLNTGQDVHIICKRKDVNKLEGYFRKIEEVKRIIVNYPSVGARLSDNHLF